MSLMGALEVFSSRKKISAESRVWGRIFTAMLPLIGGLTAAAIVALTMHALLPDTALAKAFGSSAWDQSIRMSAITIASSFSFGMGLLVLWICSLMALVDLQRVRVADLCANLLFPVVLLLSATRGQ